MSNYKDIVGTAVRNNAGNIPTAETGQVFFDSTNVDFKYQFPNTLTSWRTSVSVNTATGQLGGNGTSTSALIYGGNVPADQAKTESWNGSSWTEVNDLNLARRRLSGAGADNTSALAIGGYADSAGDRVANIESWNGSSWTEITDLNVAKSNTASSGIQTAALSFGGSTGSGRVATNEYWNGSSWTELNDLNQAREDLGGSGTYTSSLASGGQPPAYSITESWNGSSWTEVNDLNTARYAVGAGGVSNSSGIIYGGYTGTAYQAKTETWNGSSWTEENDLSTARGYVATNNGIKSSALCISGNAPPYTTATEEFTLNGAVGAWATSPSTNVAKYSMGSAGNNTSGMTFGGQTPGTNYRTLTETWDGSSWTEVADLNTARDLMGGSGASNTACLGWCGRESNPTASAKTESWNGSAWTEVADLNAAKEAVASTTGAPYTAALSFGGAQIPLPQTSLATCESWNGSSWTEVADLNAGRSYIGGFGVQTSALAYGGYDGTAYRQYTESWNGSSWTEVNDFNSPATGAMGNSGVSNSSGIKFGGAPPYLATTEDWNGASWQETSDLPTGLAYGGSIGVATNGFAVAGQQGPSGTVSSTSFEFTSPSSTIKVLTD